MLIVFEGLDNTGKTTAINNVRLALSDKGIRTVTISLPKACPYQQEVKAIFSHGPEEVSISLMLLLNYQTVLKVINENQDDDVVYLVDRFYHSTFVYQGASLSDHQYNDTIDKHLSLFSEFQEKAILYDALFYFYCDTETTKERYISKVGEEEYNKHFDEETLVKRDFYKNRYRHIVNHYSQYLKHDLGKKTYNVNTSLSTGLAETEVTNRIVDKILHLKEHP